MSGNEYFSLRLVRLKQKDEWTCKNEGYTFLFPRGGAGMCAVGGVTEHLAAGDVLILSDSAATKLRVANGAELVFWCFSLRMEHLFPLFGGREISQLQRVSEVINGAKHYPAATAIARQCQQLVQDVSPQFNLEHRSQLLRVAACLLTEEFKTLQHQRLDLVRTEEHVVKAFEKLSTDELLSSPLR